MTIKYRSTRGQQSGLSFEQVVLGGLATDKGLYVPESIPTMTAAEIEKVELVQLSLLFYIST
jgi:threonine synthase